jgi:hypothetical protein
VASDRDVAVIQLPQSVNGGFTGKFRPVISWEKASLPGVERPHADWNSASRFLRACSMHLSHRRPGSGKWSIYMQTPWYAYFALIPLSFAVAFMGWALWNFSKRSPRG